MTNTGRAPDTDVAVTPEVPDASAAGVHARSLAGSVFGRGLWLGIVVGAATGPLLAYTVVLLQSLGTPDAGAWFFLLFFVTFYFPVLVAAGAVVGAVVGASSAAVLLLALSLEARSVWRVGALLRVTAVALGSVVGGAIVLPVLAAVFPPAAPAVPHVIIGSAVIASVVALRQGKALARIRIRSAPLAARNPGVRVSRERVLRIGGTVAPAALFVALIELAAALRRLDWYSTCAELADSYLSRVDSALWPPQLTCVFVDGSIEVVPRVVYVVSCVIALVSAGLLAAGVAGSIRTAFRRGRVVAPLPLMGSIGMALLALGLAIVTAFGAFGPAAGLRPGDPTAAPVYQVPEPYSPDDGAPGEASTPEPSITPSPVAPPVEVPPPSTTYTIGTLTTELQVLVDATFAAAGPIVDPAIPPETQTFAVSAGECYVGAYTGQTARLEVGFDTADIQQSLDRVRALWAAEGYELYERTTNAKGEVLDPSIAVNATGADPQPAATLGIRVYDGFLILNVEGLCVSR
jgi:hypothetical protein